VLYLGILFVLYYNVCDKILVRKYIFWVRGFIVLGNAVIE